MRSRLPRGVLFLLAMGLCLPSIGHSLTQKDLEIGMSTGTQRPIGSLSTYVAESGHTRDIQPQSSPIDTTNASYTNTAFISFSEIFEMSRSNTMASSRLTTSVGNGLDTDAHDSQPFESRQDYNPFQTFTPIVWTMPVFSMPWFMPTVQSFASTPVMAVNASTAIHGGTDAWIPPGTFIGERSWLASSRETSAGSGIWTGSASSSFNTAMRDGGETGTSQSVSLSFFQPVLSFDFFLGRFGSVTPPAAPQAGPVTQPTPEPAPAPESPSQDMGEETTDHASNDMGGDTADQSTHDMGGDTADQGTHDMTEGHDHGDTTQPTGGLPLEATQAEIDAYVQAVITAVDMDHSMHMDDMAKMMEHAELLDLVPRAEASHIAIRNGDWFDPSTWHNGQIPGDDAKVLIPKDISIRYNGESDASLFTLRVDGELSFATDMDTSMLIDTFVVDSSGRLEIGTQDNPVQSGFDTKIIFANNGDIDVGWDPTLLSRGLISHGQVDIHGEEKTEFLKVADAPMAGDTRIVLSEIPENWSVGDTIVITGTHKEGWRWDGAKMAHFESQDEEVTITAIDGNTITIGAPLQFDHDTPRDDLAAYVANMTRNITFTSEDGEASALHHRGHVMFMHNDDVDVRYAAFDDLGRTDKSRPAGDLDFFDVIEADTNIKSRYSFHFHKTGTEIDNDPAYAIGNTVSGSPGWGFVHHSSHADFVKNVAFDVFGAAFAAEDGDETGIWRENLAIRSVGIGAGDAAVKQSPDVQMDDNGRTGDGFFFAGRLVEAMDNIAANTTHGFVWLTRGPRTDNDAGTLEHAEMAIGVDSVAPSKAPIKEFSGNEAFGTEFGLIVIKASPNQGHDFRTVIENFTNWETRNGIDLTYTSHYTLKDVDLLATQTDEWFGRPQEGIVFGTNTVDLVGNQLLVQGFETGVNFSDHFTMPIDDSDVGHVMIDLELIGNTNDFANYNPDRHAILSSDNLIDGNLGFTLHHSRPITLSENLDLSGTKTDSIGTTERGSGADPHIVYFWDLRNLVRENGYWETEDGRTVILVPDAITDRATGEILKFQHVVEISTSKSILESNLNSFSNGILEIDNQAPMVGNDAASTQINTSTTLDILFNDFDFDGNALQIDSIENPANGRVRILDDGYVAYTPDHDFSGRETFSYWAVDEYGARSSGSITVDVWDL
jgi:hypothetical protein